MESKTEVIEKRVKGTVIRRRVKVTPAEESVAPVLAEEIKGEEITPDVKQPSVSKKESSVVTESIVSAPLVKSKLSEEVQPPTKVSPAAKTTVSVTKTVPSSAASAVAVASKKEAATTKQATEIKTTKTFPQRPVQGTHEEEDRPRYGLKIVGRMEIKAPAPKPAAKTDPKAKTGTGVVKQGAGVTALPLSKTLIPEEEAGKDKKVKKGVKKNKREEIEVDLEGIGKVATLTQLTRLAATVVPEKAPSPGRDREVVFEPNRGLRRKKSRKEGKKTEVTLMKASKRVVKMGDFVTVAELAHEMSVKSGELIKKLMAMGSMVTLNQSIDFDTASLLAQEFSYEVKKDIFEEHHVLEVNKDKEEDLVFRAPVVTVMGHVDHGKTSLLDAIREAKVAVGEAGGITQHIGAYRVKLPKGEITFIDTPGHAAFTSMRARGASVTDIVILVVAADDGVMPQTIEAINHAKAAGVPIVVAVNKIDKPEADRDRIRRQLSEHGLLSEEWGGETIFSYVSAKTREGIDGLLEMLLLQAEVLDLKANPNKPAKGVVIESKLDKGRGPLATILVKEGTLRVGDAVISGMHYGKVRAMLNEKGQQVKEAGPSIPVEIIGLAGVPNAGDTIEVVTAEKIAKIVAEHREEKEKQARLNSNVRAKLEDVFSQLQKGESHELRIILKGDVQGSVEALRDALLKLSTDKVKVTALHAAVGGISESDIMLAAASNAIVVGFNVRPEIKANDLARQEGVQLKLYNIIYNAIDDVRKAMEGMLAPTLTEKYLGRAEVRSVFNITKVGTVAGCFMVDGMMSRAAKLRLLRDNVVVHLGKISSLKRFKDDVKEVQQGYECGISIENFNDIKVGDVIEGFLVESSATKL
ncbi:MAG: translation initiation factor IF-2 [Deltaproteobacteria bacterium]|nr:translation initiation factor IF-2 [Deltaproteobacteria bacterium]